jgi:hypothetical protein
MQTDSPAGSLFLQVNSVIKSAFEKIDLSILIFLILCLNLLSFTLTPNEEAYLPLAKQFMDPSWMPHSFLFNEWPGNRLVFQWVSGLFLRYVDFEHFVFFARLTVFLLISIPVGAIFKKLEIKKIYAVIIFQIYILHQSYFAQEYIFGDYESKSIAYIFVMAGVYYLLNNKYLLAIIISSAACYFHILVGGWFFVLVFIYSLCTSKSVSLILKEFLLFLLLISPLLFYLGGEIVKSGSVINGVNIDWVYVFFRNAHHTAPLTVKEMRPEVILEISVTGILFLATIFVFRKFKGEFQNKLYTLNVIIFGLLFISIGISFLDKTGFLLKFYLFRIAALGCFLMYLYLLILTKHIPKISPFLQSGFFLIGFYLVFAAGLNTFHNLFNVNPKSDYREIVNYVKNNTQPDDIILGLDDYEFSFSRDTRREEFVVYKFVPGGGQKIYEWYTRILERKSLVNNISLIQKLKQKHKLDYLLSDHNVDEGNMLKIVFRNKSYSLYKIL